MAQIVLPPLETPYTGCILNLIQCEFYDEPDFLDITSASIKEDGIVNITDAALFILDRDWHIVDVQERPDARVLVLSSHFD